MLHPLLDWEYPHWMMVAGAILVATGFIGLAFHRNVPCMAHLNHEAASIGECIAGPALSQ